MALVGPLIEGVVMVGLVDDVGMVYMIVASYNRAGRFCWARQMPVH